MQVKWSETIYPCDDVFGVGQGTRAYVVTEGVTIHQGIRKFFPNHKQPEIVLLASKGDRYIYEITIYGIAVEKVLELAKAFAEERFEDAGRIIAELTPKRRFMPSGDDYGYSSEHEE